MMRITDTVKQLLIINIIFFIGSQLVSLAYPMFTLYYPESANFKLWQILTHMFMHGSVTHIAFNMFALYSFGSTLEHFWGTKKFLFFYISCGLGAVLLYEGVNYYYVHKGLNLLVEQGQNQAQIMSVLAQGKIDTNWQNLIPLSDYNNFLEAYFSQVLGASGAIYLSLIHI
jgi:membrane associated rhomboid family serine protease